MSLTIDSRPDATVLPKIGSRFPVIDCDIHPQYQSMDELAQFLPKQWQDYMRTWGGFYRQALSDTLSHPRMAPDVARNDAYRSLLSRAEREQGETP